MFVDLCMKHVLGTRTSKSHSLQQLRDPIYLEAKTTKHILVYIYVFIYLFVYIYIKIILCMCVHI